MIERAAMTRKRGRRRPTRRFSAAYFCLLFTTFLLHNVPVSAKIRIPSPLASTDTKKKDTTSGIPQTSDPSSSETDTSKIEKEFAAANRLNRIYGIDLSSFSFASLSSQEYFSKIEARLQRLFKYYKTAQSILSRGLELLWKTTNDVVRYKFPVGIVSAWSALIVLRKILKIPERRRRKKRQQNGEELEEDRRDEEIPDTYRYVLRHSGRALDLDQDDLTSYRHLGGIEQVRARLLRSALSESGNPQDRQNQELSAEHQKEELLQSLLSVLSMEFTPGGSHSEYIRSMIPAFAKVEEYAHKLDLLPTAASTGSTTTKPTTKPTPKNSTSVDENPTQQQFTGEEHQKRLLAMALQTAEVKILDSKLRSIRDRLIRTTYRLDRTVKYWKAKVESERSLMASASTRYGKRFALLSSSPIERLKLQWSRLFHYSSASAGGGSNSKNPNFVHNSLLEGDRLRLAFAEAAYKAEIIRLGKVLAILAKRPPEMPDSTLTSALVEQQQEQRKQKEKKLLDQVWETKGDDSSTEPTMINKKPGPMGRIRNVASGTRKRIQKTLDRNKKPNESDPAEAKKSNPFSILLKPFKRPIRSIMQRWEDYKSRPRYNWFLSIRFNADGRGKFSVQTYDEGSVAIQSNVAKRILLRDYDASQKPWLEASNEWALEARGLIVDTIRGSVEASIHPNPLGGGSMDNLQINTKNGLTTIDREEAATNHLDDLEKTWRLRKYASETTIEDEVRESEPQPEEAATRQSKLLPALLSSKIISASPSIHSAPYRQWMFLYEMSRDINRLKRVGEGKSLKFKWKEVHWIHWLTQWNLVGLPSAALKIWAAMWVHEKSKPYVPKVTEISREAYVATLEILTTRFWTPFKDLVEELFSSKQGLVTGVSMAEEAESLDIMLKDLELGDGTPATRHEATLAATRQYESYMRSGLMLHALGGRLARLMLIQVQQLKVSMLDAAETIDYLFQSNKINMQLLAVIPAVGILYVGVKIFVRAIFSVRAKDLRPITSVHADMTDYLNELESNIILGKGVVSGSETSLPSSSKDSSPPVLSPALEAEQQQLGEFALTLYNYLLLLDYSSPQPFSSRQCDVIHQSLTTFLGKDGVFSSEGVTVDGQSKLLDNIQLKHQDLAKSL